MISLSACSTLRTRPVTSSSFIFQICLYLIESTFWKCLNFFFSCLYCFVMRLYSSVSSVFSALNCASEAS